MSEDKSGEGLGLDRQRQACAELCERRGWELIAELPETQSASDTRVRPQFARLLDMIDSRELDAVVVYHADRLARRLVDLETIIERCERAAVTIATVSGDLDLSTDAGRLNARILISVARAEIERKSQRQRDAATQAAEQGRPAGGGRRAYGYNADGLHLDPTEAPVVADLFRRWVAGETLGELTRWLDTEGIRTPRGHRWSTGSLRELLCNPRYAGLRGVRRVAHDDHGRPLYFASGHPRRERWHHIYGPAVWDGIVDEPTWRAALERIQDPARRAHYVGNARRYLAPGLFVCGTCDRKLITGTQQYGRAIKCPSYHHVNRKAGMIEDFVVDVALERLRRADAIDLVQRRVDSGPDLRALRDETEALRTRLNGLAGDYALGVLTRDQVATATKVATDRMTGIDTIVAAAGRVDVVTRFVGTGRDPREVWDSPDCTLMMKRGLIDALMVVRVLSGKRGRPKDGVIDPSTIDIQWREADA